MNDQVKSAVRVLDLMELFSVSKDPMGVSEISRQMGIPKSSAQALLTTLASRAYLIKTEKGYEMDLASKQQGWGGGLLPRLQKIAEPVMAQLADATSESVFLSVITPSLEMKYISKAISKNLVRYDAPLSHLRPAYCVSSGVILLAYLNPDALDRYFEKVDLVAKTPSTPTNEAEVRTLIDQAKQQGYATLQNTHVDGATGVSAAIIYGEKRPLASLTIVGPSDRASRQLDALTEAVVRTAKELSDRISTI